MYRFEICFGCDIALLHFLVLLENFSEFRLHFSAQECIISVLPVGCFVQNRAYFLRKFCDDVLTVVLCHAENKSMVFARFYEASRTFVIFAVDFKVHGFFLMDLS